TVTIVKRPENVFYVACIPKSFLDQDALANLSAMSLLAILFDRKSPLYIISRDLLAMDLVLDGMRRDWAKTNEIKAIFIPWSSVKRFLAEQSQQRKVQLVKTMLELGEPPEIATPPPVATPPPIMAATQLTPA